MSKVKDEEANNDAVQAGIIYLALFGYFELWKHLFTEKIPVFGRKRELFNFKQESARNTTNILMNEGLFLIIFLGYHLFIICTLVYGEDWFDKDFGHILFPIIYIIVPVIVGIHFLLWDLYEENPWYKSQSKMVAICISIISLLFIRLLLNFYYEPIICRDMWGKVIDC